VKPARGASNSRRPDFFPKSDRRENDDRDWESHHPKHNRFTQQNSFSQDRFHIFD
jgi:hypothetical protein